MRKLLALIALLLVHTSLLFAQGVAVNSDNTTPTILKPSRDFVLLKFGYSNWMNKPDSVKTKSFGYNFGAELCYDFPIKHSNLSFAAGLGISANVMYLDGQTLSLSDTGARGAQAGFVSDTLGNKRYKFVTAYLTAPFELRYFSNKNNRNKGFKAAIGLDVGTLVGAHTKAVRTVEGTTVKDKVDTKRYMTQWSFAGTARVGWGNFSLYGSYNFTDVFKKDMGPTLTPITIGICLTGL